MYKLMRVVGAAAVRLSAWYPWTTALLTACVYPQLDMDNEYLKIRFES